MSAQYHMICLGITAVLLFVLPIAATLYWKKKNGREVSWKPLFIGAAGFIITVRVLELLVHMVCIVMDNPISRTINGNTVLFVLYGILMAGIFEECGRYIIIRFIMKKNKTKKNMVMYGIGHGGIEVWAISLVAIMTYLAVAVIVNTYEMDQAMTMLNVTAEAQESFAPVLDAVTTFGITAGALTIVERIFAMTLHIALTIVVFQSIQENDKRYLLLAVALHAVFDLFPAMYQRGVVSMELSQVWLLICSVGVGIYGYKIYKKMRDEYLLT